MLFNKKNNVFTFSVNDDHQSKKSINFNRTYLDTNVLTFKRQHVQYLIKMLVAFWLWPSLAETCQGSILLL